MKTETDDLPAIPEPKEWDVPLPLEYDSAPSLFEVER